MSETALAVSSPWYRSLNREQWRVLIASNLGWLFDGFEIYALFVTVGFALHQLLDPSQYSAVPKYVGYVLATTVFGWATGGVVGGIIADYIGRKRTMMLAILAYSLTTGLSAFAWSWESFAVLRFLVGVGIGSEWATGACCQRWCACGFGGTFRSRRAGSSRTSGAGGRALRAGGGAVEGETAALNRFTVTDLFAEKAVRRPLIASFVMMLSVTFAFWGVAMFIPTYVGAVAAKAGGSAAEFAGYASLLTNICGTVGFVALGFLADTIGRKPTVMLWYTACLVLTPVVYL